MVAVSVLFPCEEGISDHAILVSNYHPCSEQSCLDSCALLCLSNGPE